MVPPVWTTRSAAFRDSGAEVASNAEEEARSRPSTRYANTGLRAASRVSLRVDKPWSRRHRMALAEVDTNGYARSRGLSTSVAGLKRIPEHNRASLQARMGPAA
jgi:hypothetical protein